jgi:general nucleoside transport system permease protein
MDLDRILSISFLVSLLASGIRLSIPIFLAALGEIVTEKSGIRNLGLEGMMLTGALGGFSTTYLIESNSSNAGIIALAPWFGMLTGVVSGIILGLLFAFLVIRLRTNQIVAGVSISLLGSSIATYAYHQYFVDFAIRISGFNKLQIPILSDLPVLGDLLFKHDIMTYVSIVLLSGVLILLYKTTWGLSVGAAGVHPASADTSGINVNRIRFQAVLFGAALAGLGGAVLTVAHTHLFVDGVTAGRGWIAFALVIFAKWKPTRAYLGALLFGVADALQFRVQALGIEAIPYEFLLMLPYLLTIIVLFRSTTGFIQPVALGKPYVKQ